MLSVVGSVGQGIVTLSWVYHLPGIICSKADHFRGSYNFIRIETLGEEVAFVTRTTKA